MFELIGITGIAGVVAGSVLLSLFIAEAFIGLTLRAMQAGVKRANEQGGRSGQSGRCEQSLQST